MCDSISKIKYSKFNLDGSIQTAATNYKKVPFGKIASKRNLREKKC